MSKLHTIFKALLVCGFVFALVSLAQAQAAHTYVSAEGDDVDPCSRTAPCKNFRGRDHKDLYER